MCTILLLLLLLPLLLPSVTPFIPRINHYHFRFIRDQNVYSDSTEGSILSTNYNNGNNNISTASTFMDSDYSYTSDYDEEKEYLDIIQNRTKYYNEMLTKKYEIYRNSFLDNFQDENYDENFMNNLVSPNETPQVVARVVEWIIKRIVRLRALFVSGLRINVLSPSNRGLLQGKIQVLAMKFDKIGYGQLLVTGGGRLLIEGLELRMRRFLLGLGSNNLSLRSPYRIFGDFLLTQSDIVNSALIKNLFQMLINTIFARALGYASELIVANINTVIIKERRIYAGGDVNVLNIPASYVTFEVSFGIGVKNDGQVIYLRDIEVILNPNNYLKAVVPITTDQPIDVDIGDSCRIKNLVIADETVWIRAISTIFPEQYSVTPSTIALYKYDLSNFLSGILRLQGGILVLPVVQSAIKKEK